MERIKTILDRKPMSSEYINSKQDFNTVLSGVQKVKTPMYKSGWFYGTVGLATVAIVERASVASVEVADCVVATTDHKHIVSGPA